MKLSTLLFLGLGGWILYSYNQKAKDAVQQAGADLSTSLQAAKSLAPFAVLQNLFANPQDAFTSRTTPLVASTKAVGLGIANPAGITTSAIGALPSELTPGLYTSAEMGSVTPGNWSFAQVGTVAEASGF